MAFMVGGRHCEHGFDWSYWQSPRPLEAAAAAGHSFFVVKATEGDSYRDPKYGQHVANGVSAGLLVGAYHFARPDWSDGGPYNDGAQEAELFLSVVDDRIKFAVLDLEATILSAGQTTEYVNGWLDKIAASGRFPLREQRLLYVGMYFNWLHTIDTANKCCLWIPWYTMGYTPNVDPAAIPLPNWAKDLWPEGWCMWQYSSSGTVAGLSPSDVNVATTEWLDAVRGGTASNPEAFSEPGGQQMAQPVWWLDGAGHYLVPDKDAPRGLSWRWIDGPGQLATLSLNFVVNSAINVTLAQTGTEAWDEEWERWPVQNGPHKRDARAS